jgi:transposase
MRGQLSKESRLQINVTRLKNNALRFRSTISNLRGIIKEQHREILELKEKLVNKEAQRKELQSYLYKPGKRDDKSLRRGKKPGSPAYHRPIPPESAITDERAYTPKVCPICKGAVGKAVDMVIKYEEDIDLKPKPTVVKNTITRHWCSHCETYVKSKNIPPMKRIGVKTMAYILYSRYRLRLPIEKIVESLKDLYDFKISEGEIVATLKDAEELFGKDYEAITVLIQDAKAVYADETGWRMDGKNWWLWVFTTTTGTKYVIEDTRGKGVPERILGDKEDRVIISDGYAAYQNLHGDKQQCWVHLLRSADLNSPTLHIDLVALYKKLLLELEKPLGHRDKGKLLKQFDLLLEKKYPEPTVEKVKKRMRHHRTVLFTCVDFENVLPENNTAERAIRPQVVMRKIFGGTRSLAGTKAHTVNSSVIETMRKQNPDKSFFDVIVPLLEKRRSEL